jgi:hypothetical protein
MAQTPNRHIACGRCRERKVKCDGNRPQCNRCSRSGSKCIYPPAMRQGTASKARRPAPQMPNSSASVQTISTSCVADVRTPSTTKSDCLDDPEMPTSSSGIPSTSNSFPLTEDLPSTAFGLGDDFNIPVDMADFTLSNGDVNALLMDYLAQLPTDATMGSALVNSQVLELTQYEYVQDNVSGLDMDHSEAFSTSGTSVPGLELIPQELLDELWVDSAIVTGIL